MMLWPVRCCVFLTILKLSYQLGCPYSHQMQMLMAPSKGVAVTYPGPKSNPFLIQNNYHPNEIKNNPEFYGDLLGEQPIGNGIFSSLEGAARLSCAIPPPSCANDSSNFYYRSYDGSCNNMAYPGYGMANSRYARILKPKYGDAKYTPSRSVTGAALPNPRLLSLSLYGDETIMDSFRTMMTMQWGQIVGHDISELMMDSEVGDCCENPNNKLCYPIPMHVYGPITLGSGKTCQSFTRGLSDADLSCSFGNLGYAEKLTKATPYLDLSSLYGNSLEQNIKVRQYQGGLLKTVWYNHQQFLPITSNINGECQKDVDQCYGIPDIRNQLQPTIVVMHTILVREHNRLANILAKLNPQYSDEKLFQVARKINIAQYQKISYYDWLPLLLGSTCYTNRLTYNVGRNDYVNDYEESYNPAPYAESSIAALRYTHTNIPGWFSLVSPDRYHNQTLRLSDYFKRPQTLATVQTGHNFDALVRGLITQLQKRADPNIDKDIKHSFDRKVFDEFGFDLKSIDIQRGRDFGLASYNDYRAYCGLPRAYHWSDFANEISPEKIALLQKFYASPNDVELNIGGSLEKHTADGMFGPTFTCIVAKEFLKIRKSDRFFFEHNDLNTGFTQEQLAEIRKISLAGILCANTIGVKYFQPNVFVYPNEENNLVSCKAIPQLNLRLWQEQGGY